MLLSPCAGAAEPGADQEADASFATPESGLSRLWTAVLTAHVDDDGKVDYAALRADSRFRDVLQRLASADPGTRTSEERLAFWINAYNALAMQGVLQTLPEDPAFWSKYSVMEVQQAGVKEPGKAFFDVLTFEVARQRLSLNQIEKEILLHRGSERGQFADLARALGPKQPDARVHFALVCASQGCPALARQAFNGEQIGQQLDAAVRRFAVDEGQWNVDADKRTIRTSKLIEWYGEDLTNPAFEGTAPSVPAFFSRYVADTEISKALRAGDWKLSYLPYDWRLNLR